jgi:hypothetical protein
MPSVSKKQHNFMEAIANNPAFAKKAGVPQSVGKDFSKADKGKSFSKGGDMAQQMDPRMLAMMMAKKKAMGRPPMGGAPQMPAPSGMPPAMKRGGDVKESKAMVKKEVDFFKKKGAPASMVKHEEAEMKGMSRGGGVEKRGKTQGKMVKMAKGGMFTKAANGVAQRGKTKATQIKMNRGGKAC